MPTMIHKYYLELLLNQGWFDKHNDSIFPSHLLLPRFEIEVINIKLNQQNT